MDRQLAERMVGAACLLAVLVLVVPSILDGNPDSSTTVTHPVVDEPVDLRTHTIRLDAEEREPPVPMSAAPAATEPSINERQPPAAPVPEPAVPATESSKVASSSSSVPAAKTPSREAQVPAKVAVKAPPPAPAAKPVGAKTLPTVPAKAPDNAATGKWIVQLGSFSQRDNADRLLAELKRKGFDAMIQSGGGSSGTLFRVRAGPVADRAAADALARRLTAAGFTGGRVGRP